MKRIFYFNITYGCNSNCIFCYSHNTWHNAQPHNEMTVEQFFAYLDDKELSAKDRVIVNGGEPLMHTEIGKILGGLLPYGCEVLIYTNGRMITNYDLSCLNENFRFIIPIHGYEEIHDSITRVKGSYQETIAGLKYLVEQTNCPVDVKLILNNRMIEEDPSGDRTLQAFEREILFDHAIHLTKMADTIVSAQNGCKTISNDDASRFMKIFFDYFSQRNVKIKIFDSCIKSMEWMRSCEVKRDQEALIVYFKDRNQYRIMDLTRNRMDCMADCPFADRCMSAVDEYKALEFFENRLYENLE